VLARIVVDPITFEKNPAVFRDIQSLSKQIHQDTDVVLIEPRKGFLVSILVLLNRAEIEFQITYDTRALHVTNHKIDKSR
jgi:hypothetical protein